MWAGQELRGRDQRVWEEPEMRWRTQRLWEESGVVEGAEAVGGTRFKGWDQRLWEEPDNVGGAEVLGRDIYCGRMVT